MFNHQSYLLGNACCSCPSESIGCENGLCLSALAKSSQCEFITMTKPPILITTLEPMVLDNRDYDEDFASSIFTTLALISTPHPMLIQSGQRGNTTTIAPPSD